MYGVIYCVINKFNEKKYIGQTINFNKRKKWHKSKIRKLKDYFHCSLYKYGWENFSWDIIDFAYNRKDMNNKEIFWIDLYETFADRTKGYNLTPGGEGIGRIVSSETKQKLSNGRLGKFKGKNAPNTKPVQCKETKEIFDTLIDVYKKYNIDDLIYVNVAKEN